MRHFGRNYRCIAFNARGFPPSDVPEQLSMYGQRRAAEDIRDVMRHLAIDEAHIMGLSQGGYATLHFGLEFPEMARSLVIGGCGCGADAPQQWRQETEALAARFADEGVARVADSYTLGPTRVQFQNKDPRGWQEFSQRFNEHSALGSALTMRGVQKERPSIYDLADGMAKMCVPSLIITGDEDEPCLDPNVFMKRTIPWSWLAVIPASGHAINLEEPDLFNLLVQRFLGAVDSGGFRPRDPRSKADTLTGAET